MGNDIEYLLKERYSCGSPCELADRVDRSIGSWLFNTFKYMTDDEYSDLVLGLDIFKESVNSSLDKDDSSIIDNDELVKIAVEYHNYLDSVKNQSKCEKLRKRFASDYSVFCLSLTWLLRGESKKNEPAMATAFILQAIIFTHQFSTHKRELMREASSKALDVRHKEHREMGVEVKDWYRVNGGKFKSKDSAAMAAMKIVPLEFSTIRKHFKNLNYD